MGKITIRGLNSLSQNLTVLPAPSGREPTLSVTAYAAYPFRLAAARQSTFPKGTAEPSQSRLTACQLPRGGSFISGYRQMRKSSPFGGAGERM